LHLSHFGQSFKFDDSEIAQFAKPSQFYIDTVLPSYYHLRKLTGLPFHTFS
jgi:hypothetical protein